MVNRPNDMKYHLKHKILCTSFIPSQLIEVSIQRNYNYAFCNLLIGPTRNGEGVKAFRLIL